MLRQESTSDLMGVAETLMITLYARAVETQCPDPILSDRHALALTQQLDYDFSKYEKGWASQLGCILRAKTLDRMVQNFLETHPSAIVVNLGAGLCTRFLRLDNGEVRWYEVDFPEVIALRHKLFNVSKRHQFIAQSILDFSWMDAIECSPYHPILILYEGVSMYLSELENRLLLYELEQRFAPLTVMFDVLSRRAARRTQAHDTVSKTNAEFKWGINQSGELETWSPNIILKREEFYLEQYLNYPDRLPTSWRLAAQIVPFIPLTLFKNIGRVVQLQINQSSTYE